MFYQVNEQVVMNWARELDEHIIKRICEVWNSRTERTCKNVRSWANHEFECSVCGYELYPEDGTYESDGTLNYCPNCGARVTKSDQYL